MTSPALAGGNPAWKQAWPLFVLCALAVLFLADMWFGGKMPMLRDFFFGDEPNRLFLGQSLRNGEIPIWNSLWQCGVPNAAQPYYGTFYPPNWLYIFPQEEGVIRLWLTFHFAMAAISTFALARHWRMSVGPAMLAAIGFAFGTYMVTWMEFAHGFCCMAWMPLAVLFVSKIIDQTAERRQGNTWALLRGNALSIVGLALVLALQILASAEYIYYSSLFVAGYGVAKWIWLRSWRVTFFSGLWIGLAGLLALGLAMPQLILTLELMNQSVRVGEVDAFLNTSSAHPRHWLSLLIPYLYGRPGYPSAFWAPTIYEFAIGSCYVGILPLIGAFFSWLRPKQESVSSERRFLCWFLLATTVAGLIMAAGKYTPVYPFLHHWFPGLGHLRFPSKFYLFASLALPLLGGLGFQSLLDRNGTQTKGSKLLWWTVLAVFGIFLTGYLASFLNEGFLTWLMAHPSNPSALQIDAVFTDYTWAAVFTVLGLLIAGFLMLRKNAPWWIQACLVTVAFANMCVVSRQAQPMGPAGIYEGRPEALAKWIHKDPLYRFFPYYWGAQQYLYGDTRASMFDWARQAGSANQVLVEGVQDIAQGAMVLGRYMPLYHLFAEGPPPLQMRLADILAVRYIAFGAPFEQVLWGGASPEIKFFERPESLPRAFLVSKWRVIQDADEVLRTIIQGPFDPRTEALLEPLPGEQIPSGDATGAAGGEVRSLQDHNTTLSMEVTAKSRSLLVLSDSWYPGWSVTVDGAPKPIFRTNYHFRGVFLEPGTHRISFAYKATGLATGMWLFGISAAMCLGLAWLARKKVSAPSPRGTPESSPAF